MSATAKPPTLEEYEHKIPSPNRLQGGAPAQSVSSPAQPLVSIITVVRNGQQTIARTIESVRQQDYPSIEYIMIDGGSTDGTLDLLRKYHQLGVISYWVSEPDEGISDAFNKGIAAAHGTWIGLINADDWYEPSTVSTVFRNMKGDTGIVHGMRQFWNGNTKTMLQAANHDLLERDMTINHPTVFVKREVYQRRGLYRTDFKYAMDYEWLLRAKSSGEVFFYVPEVLANMAESGVSDRHWRRALADVRRAQGMYLPGVRHHFRFWARIIKGTTRKMLTLVGLGSVVRFYHKHCSIVTKTH